MLKATVLIGDFEISLTEAQIDRIIGDFSEDKANGDLFDYIARNTINIELIRSIVQNEGTSDETIKFLLETKKSDIYLWRNVILSNRVRELIEEDELLDLMKSSDAISEEVARYVEGFDACDALKIADWICNNSSYETIKCLAQNSSTPNKVLKKLAKHPNSQIAQAAKNSL